MPNRLAHEQSPYLRQHSENPVDWFPWGEEAFAKARAEDKPIFLSIGYSTCHWCHVMERESFEDVAVAGLLNRNFVPIKVDREERPDVDRIYMTFVQATTGSGGWPMSVFLTPSLEPFFGGTYFQPDNRYGRPGFSALLEHLANAWRADRARILEAGVNSIVQLRQMLTPARTSPELDEKLLDSGFAAFRRSFDSKHGGFGHAPKFPRPSALNFLLRYYRRTGSEEALEMTTATLRAMADGGMNDQLGGGFHRYSVDERWFVPHFEKMLYDQAQLAVSYLEAFQITRDGFYARIARDVLDYVLRDMTHREGGFFSAEDADSAIDPSRPEDKGEGAFYVWTNEEIERILGAAEAAVFSKRFGVATSGNVRDDPHAEFTGRNILAVRDDEPETADIPASRAKLLAARAARVRPNLDDKILTSWNALMISAFAKASQILDDPRYLGAAQRAADFVLRRLRDPKSGALFRRFRDGEAAIPAFLDDYAFLIQALLDLYEADFDVAHIATAVDLAESMLAQFEDRERGAFFSTAEGDPRLLLRIKEDYDGAEPSGNSIAILALSRLAQFTDRDDFRRAATRALEALSSKLASEPSAAPQLLVALDFHLAHPMQIVIAGDPADPRAAGLLRARNRRFIPVSVTMFAGSAKQREAFRAWVPAVVAMTPVEGCPAAYVCRDYSCQIPVTDEEKFLALLQ